MDIDTFAKKIISILNEVPLEKKIEDKIAKARKMALYRAKKSTFIEFNSYSHEVLKNLS
jgi:hypothetical protein